MTTEQKAKFYRKLDEKTGILSHPTSVHETINSQVSGFPKNLWSQWRVDCEHQFNDIFWSKMWSDHVKAQAYDLIINSAVQQVQQEPQAQPQRENEQDLGLMSP